MRNQLRYEHICGGRFSLDRNTQVLITVVKLTLCDFEQITLSLGLIFSRREMEMILT